MVMLPATTCRAAMFEITSAICCSAHSSVSHLTSLHHGLEFNTGPEFSTDMAVGSLNIPSWLEWISLLVRVSPIRTHQGTLASIYFQRLVVLSRLLPSTLPRW